MFADVRSGCSKCSIQDELKSCCDILEAIFKLLINNYDSILILSYSKRRIVFVLHDHLQE